MAVTDNSDAWLRHVQLLFLFSHISECPNLSFQDENEDVRWKISKICMVVKCMPHIIFTSITSWYLLCRDFSNKIIDWDCLKKAFDLRPSPSLSASQRSPWLVIFADQQEVYRSPQLSSRGAPTPGLQSRSRSSSSECPWRSWSLDAKVNEFWHPSCSSECTAPYINPIQDYRPLYRLMAIY